MSKSEHLIDVAIARLARGDGCGSLRDLGVNPAEAIRDSGVGKGTFYSSRFRQRGQGDPLRGLVNEVLARLEAEQLRLREEAAVAYDERAGIVADGGGRKVITSALLGELERYGAVADADDLTRARERAYYLAVALADVSSTDNQKPISDDVDPKPDLRFRRHALALHNRHRDALVGVYGQFLAAANRVPIHDVERVESVISAFLEGALLMRRVERGHGALTKASREAEGERPRLTDDELVDAVFRVFIAMSQPIGGVPADPDVLLFGRDRAATPSVPSEAVVHQDRGAMYTSIVDAIDRLDGGETLSHCALHNSGARPTRTDEGRAFKAAQSRFVDRGGRVRNIEKVDTVEQLDETVARLAAEHDAEVVRDVAFRVLVMDSPPGLSPLIVGDHVAYLGREVDGLIVDAVAFRDAAGLSWCEAHYDTVWHDDRAYTLATPNGLNSRGIDDARRQLATLAPV